MFDRRLVARFHLVMLWHHAGSGGKDQCEHFHNGARPAWPRIRRAAAITPAAGPGQRRHGSAASARPTRIMLRQHLLDLLAGRPLALHVTSITRCSSQPACSPPYLEAEAGVGQGWPDSSPSHQSCSTKARWLAWLPRSPSHFALVAGLTSNSASIVVPNYWAGQHLEAQAIHLQAGQPI